MPPALADAATGEVSGGVLREGGPLLATALDWWLTAFLAVARAAVDAVDLVSEISSSLSMKLCEKSTSLSLPDVTGQSLLWLRNSGENDTASA